MAVALTLDVGLDGTLSSLRYSIGIFRYISLEVFYDIGKAM